jgi:hypothetical protein
MKYFYVTIACLILAAVSGAEEIDAELNVSLVGKPYEKALPGFGGSYRPDFLQFGEFSLGAGLLIDISDRFLYQNNDPQVMPDSVEQNSKQWYYESDYFIEFVNFDFFAEGRWKFLGEDAKKSLKGWLTLNLGAIINSGARYQNLTNFQDSVGTSGIHYIVDFRQAEYTLTSVYRTDPYVSPGLLIGIGNFYFGYRHWLFFDKFDVDAGEPARMLGTIRLGYRFTW